MLTELFCPRIEDRLRIGHKSTLIEPSLIPSNITCYLLEMSIVVT